MNLDKTQAPLISVVIPVLNRSELLVRALESVFNQTYRNFEVLVVDDHSTEDISIVCQSYNVTYLKSSGSGVSAARNTGIHFAKGDWIAFLDSDDEWSTDKLQKQIAYVQKNSELRFVYTGEIWLRLQKKVQQSAQQRKYGGRIFSECAERCFIAPSSVLLHKSLLKEVGPFDESFPVCEDFDLWLRIAAQENIGFLEETLIVKHGGHADQLSRQHHSMDLWRVRAMAKHLQNPHLHQDEQKTLRKNMEYKIQILLKGFEKHKNTQFVQEIRSYQSQLS
jgi:glycosyltransferase involved in cell wall biosynthesis